jgi:hypothetical protein
VSNAAVTLAQMDPPGGPPEYDRYFCYAEIDRAYAQQVARAEGERQALIVYQQNLRHCRNECRWMQLVRRLLQGQRRLKLFVVGM